MTRNIDAPGIELREQDRSQYDQKNDYSIVGTTVFMTGFAAKGEDYSVKWINTAKNFVDTYGYPENEIEQYFHAGALEVLNKGGVLMTAKLPYDNAAKDKYTFTTYKVENPNVQSSDSIASIEDIQDLHGVYDTIYQIQETLRNLLNILGIADEFDISNLFKMKQCVDDLIQHRLSELGASSSAISTTNSIKTDLQNLITLLKNEHTSCFAILDSGIRRFLKIVPQSQTGKMALDEFDNLKTSSRNVPLNTIKIVDITRGKYSSIDVDCVTTKMEIDGSVAYVNTNECLGIVPVIVSPANAIYIQHLLELEEFDKDSYPLSMYNCINGIELVKNQDFKNDILVDLSKLNEHYTMNFGSNNKDDYTVSRLVAEQFPNITFDRHNHFDTTYLKQIGVVVLKMFKDQANDDKISFSVLETFIGSLDRTAKDQYTNASIFIDDIINRKSNYINFFSNVDPIYMKNIDLVTITNQTATSLGFYNIDCKKIVDIKNSILTPLSYIFSKCKDPNQINIDLVLDAGVSNIAQLASSCGNSDKIDFTVYTRIIDHDSSGQKWRLNSDNDAKKWSVVQKRFDDFCKISRRDCMFLADGLRTFCLTGNQKIVRDTVIDSSIAKDILPKLKYMSGLNSSYSAGYCNWFLVTDNYTNDVFWCPPSIKMAGIYIYTDAYYHKWDAPAGHRRGVINNILDCAFSPTIDEAGKIYNQAWNYAINYPIDGIIAEGQKTMQLKKTAFDRINVRRLFLYLEKNVGRVAQFFKYEDNSQYRRQLFVDTIRPLFEDAVKGNGIAEYAIKCDDENNTDQTIENNELHCKIAIRPIKTIEFIVLDFICTNQSAVVSETILS